MVRTLPPSLPPFLPPFLPHSFLSNLHASYGRADLARSVIVLIPPSLPSFFLHLNLNNIGGGCLRRLQLLSSALLRRLLCGFY
jgi:hypothetical protein